MKNLWSDQDAKAAINHHAGKGINEDLALRVYTTRLLGGEPKLVLHGGGNTSVKTRMADVTGQPLDVLCVKGSGWDMGTIEAPGLPAVRLAPLRELEGLQALSDEDMVNVQRSNLLDAKSPNPSVETLLHAFLPHKFIDHTHSNAVLSLTDQPDGEALARDLYGKRAAMVPYVMPGFGLAKKCSEVGKANPDVEGLILLKHGIFSMGATAEEAYVRMIDLVTLAEKRLARGEQLVAQKMIGQSEFDDLRNARDLAKVELDSSQEALRRADAILGEAREQLVEGVHHGEAASGFRSSRWR